LRSPKEGHPAEKKQMRKRRITEYQITAIEAGSLEVVELVSQAHAKALSLLDAQVPMPNEPSNSREEDSDTPIGA